MRYRKCPCGQTVEARFTVCPACKSDVELRDEKIVCTKCGRRYPIKDGIPVMLIDEAERPEK